MGQIINLDTWEGEPPDALTETGRGGFLSSGYLAERPAAAYVEADETPQFVLTNKKQGVTVEAETTTHVTPDSRYRTVAVLTDRRVVVLVGGEDGDEQFEVPMASVDDVETTRGRRNGRVTVVRDGGDRFHVHTGSDGLDAVESYLRETATAWGRVEELLRTVERKLSRAERQREDGECDDALASVRGTDEQLTAAQEVAVDYSTDDRGEPLRARVAAVEARCRAALADVRVAQARAAVETAESRCADGEYESAQAAYERARDRYDDALRVEELTGPARIRGARERIDHLVTELQASPLRKAVAADRDAVDAEDPAVAAQHWKTALTQYREALDADPDDQFTGDPERIRERMVSVGERLTAIQRTIGNDAMQAGDWYSDAGQHDAALTEFEHAAEAFETALSTAREWYPEATTHLEAEQRAVRQRIERTEAALDGEESFEDRIQTSDEPDYDIEAMVESIDEPTDIEASIEPPAVAVSSASESVPETTAARLTALDQAAATEIVAAALEETDWSVRPAARRTPFDLWANRGEELMGVVVHLPEGESINGDLVNYCEVVTGAGGTDTVMLATTGDIHESDAALAEELGVRLLEGETLAAIVDGSDVHLPAPERVEEPQ